jgi:hypothetical protein
MIFGAKHYLAPFFPQLRHTPELPLMFDHRARLRASAGLSCRLIMRSLPHVRQVAASTDFFFDFMFEFPSIR